MTSTKGKANLLFRKNYKENKQNEKKTTITEVYLEEPIVEISFPVTEKDNKEIEVPIALIDELIYRDISVMLDEEKENLYRIEDEIEYIEKDEENASLSKEATKLKKELESIERKLKQLGDKLDKIKDLSFRSFSDADDMQIELFEINDALLSERAKELDTTKIKQYIEIVDRLIKAGDAHSRLKDKVDDKSEKLEESDKAKDKLDKKLEISEKELEKMEDFTDRINTSLEELQAKINKPIEIEERIFKYRKLVAETDKVLEAIILFSIGNKTKHPALASALKFGAVISMGKVFRFKTVTEKSTSVHMEDLTSLIKKNKDSIEDVSLQIDDALNSIEDIKDVFDEHLKGLTGEIPEYQKMFRNILKLEANMIKEQERIYEQKKSLTDKEKEYSVKTLKYQKITDAV